MEWTAEAEAAIKKVPFFVRKKVRARVERGAQEAGRSVVSILEVNAAKERYLHRMESEVTGYRLDCCFGPSGCPNRAAPGDSLAQKIESLLKNEDILTFLKGHVKGSLKFHHEFRVAIAECPNACSQPQIQDIGIIGACVPGITGEPCSRCESCVDVCREEAVSLNPDEVCPAILADKCLKCGRCIPVCPTGTIAGARKGFRVQLGGKLGRHPRLATELPGIYGEEEVVSIVKDCLVLYKGKSRNGKRFAEIVTESDIQGLSQRYPKEKNPFETS
jgi:dissimilatory sulfite reductase (desulfoviridin) alpha/beta subunit